MSTVKKDYSQIKGVAIFIVCEGSIFLQTRTDDAPTLPNEVCQHGGDYEADDESPEHAAQRETEEETNALFEMSRFIPIGISRFGTAFFVLRVKQKEKHLLGCHEGQMSLWYTFDGMLFPESMRRRRTAISYFRCVYGTAIKRMMEGKHISHEDLGLMPYGPFPPLVPAT